MTSEQEQLELLRKTLHELIEVVKNLNERIENIEKFLILQDIK